MISGRMEYKSPCVTDPLLFCVYLLLRNMCLASRWLAMDYSDLSRKRVLVNRWLANALLRLSCFMSQYLESKNVISNIYSS
jgi:hypothetical protein